MIGINQQSSQQQSNLRTLNSSQQNPLKQRIREIVSLMGVLIWASLQGCDLRIRSIQSVQTQEKYPKIVLVRGIVRDRVPLINQSVYQLQDSSGSIWVLSSNDHSPPSIGVSVQVKGNVAYQPTPQLDNQTISLRESRYYLKELHHTIIDP